MNFGLGIINRYKHLIRKLSPYLISISIVFLFVAHWVFTFYIIYLRIPLIDIVWFLWLVCLFLGMPLANLLYIGITLCRGIIKRKPFVMKVALSFIYLLVWFCCVYIYGEDSPDFGNMKVDSFKKHSHQYKQFAEKVIAENEKKLNSEKQTLYLPCEDVPRSLPARSYRLSMSTSSDSTYDFSMQFYVYPMGIYTYTKDQRIVSCMKEKCSFVELENDWYYVCYF